MKISVFGTLQAVLRTGSLAGAAAQMNLTPSAVSMQMKQLEAHFGQPLFDRSGLQVRATPLAREIAEVLRQPMQRLEMLRLNRSGAVEGALRLGVIETMQSSLLPGTLRLLRERYPALRVSPVRGRSVELVDAVKAGAIDAAVVVQPGPGASTRLSWQPLLRSELMLVAPPDSTETRLPALLDSHEWIRFDPATTTGRLAARYVHRYAPNARCTLELQSVQAVVAAVSAGLGASVVVMPDPQLGLAYPVRVLSLGAGVPTMQISLVMRKVDAGERRLTALREAITGVLRPPC
jgi:DNA-binding transcriptional LysR family regulator